MDSPRIGSEVDVDYRRIDGQKMDRRLRLWNFVVAKVTNLGPLFWITVVIPTATAILYFGIFASDVYISESRFVVRSPEKPEATGLGVLLKSTGFSNGGDEIYAAQDFVLSRDALKTLNRSGSFERAFGNTAISIFDRFNGSGFSHTFEDLYKYYQNRVTLAHDTTSSITTLTVRAYAPMDAYRVNENLLEMAEATVNRLNDRGRQDLIRFGQREVQSAKLQAQQAAFALAAYRNREGVVDPESQAAVKVEMVSKLQDELIAARMQLSELRRLAPQNPQIPVLEMRSEELASEVESETGKIAGDRKSLSSTAPHYQRLLLESQFADKQLASAMASLEEAKNEARRKQAYVERIVQPNIPDYALEPRRMRGILATFALSLVAYGILRMMLAGLKEHAQ